MIRFIYGIWCVAFVVVFVLLAQTNGLQPHVTLMPKADGSLTHELRFRELFANGTEHVAFRAPTSIAGSIAWVLPSAPGATNAALTTDGSNNLSWVEFLRKNVAETTNSTLQVVDSDSGLILDVLGGLEIIHAGNTPFIDFKSIFAEDFDIRMQQISSDLFRFTVGGSVVVDWTSGGVSIFPNLNVGGANSRQLSVNDGGTEASILSGDGGIELAALGGASIDFKTSTAEDFDARIIQVSNGLSFRVGGNGTTLEILSLNSDGTATMHANWKVGTGNIATNAITVTQMGDNAVGTLELIDTTVAQVDMANNSIGTAQLIDANVTLAKMAGDSVNSAKVVDASLTPADVNTALKTEQISWTLFDALVDIPDTFDISRIYSVRARAIHITEIQCDSDNGTATINIQRDDGIPANILASNLTCNGTPSSTFTAGEDALSVGHYLNHVTVSAGASLRRAVVTLKYTVD